MLDTRKHQQGMFEGLDRKVESAGKKLMRVPGGIYQNFKNVLVWIYRNFKLDILNHKRMMEAIRTRDLVSLGEAAFLVVILGGSIYTAILVLAYKLDGWYADQMILLLNMSFPILFILLVGLLFPFFLSARDALRRALHGVCPACGCRRAHEEDAL